MGPLLVSVKYLYMYTGVVRNQRLNIDIRYGIIFVSGKLHGKVEGFLTQGNIYSQTP
jgi:hypothetical protein